MSKEVYKPPQHTEHQQYRDEIAERLRESDGYLERRAILREAQQMKEYQDAKAWRQRWRRDVIENREQAKERLRLGIIDDTAMTESQFIVTERLLDEIDTGILDAERLLLLAKDPSPFIRLDVAERAYQEGNQSLLLSMGTDEVREIREQARHMAVAIELATIRREDVDEGIAYRSTDLYKDVPLGEGQRFFILQLADRDGLKEEFNLSDDEAEYLQLSVHFRKEENVDIFSWATVDVRQLSDGRKVWIVEELQSDLLQRTKNKELGAEYSEQCDECEGKGTIRISKKEGRACGVCTGAGILPTYQEALMEHVKVASKKCDVSLILVPTADAQVEKWQGMLKPNKAKRLYDTVPERMGMERIDVGEDIVFGEEDGGIAGVKEFWSFSV